MQAAVARVEVAVYVVAVEVVVVVFQYRTNLEVTVIRMDYCCCVR